MSGTTESTASRRDPLAISSPFIAFFLLVPVQSGVLDPGLRAGRYGAVVLLFLAIFGVASIPFWLSVRRRRREPRAWGSWGFLVGTGVILSLDVLWFTSVMVYQFLR